MHKFRSVNPSNCVFAQQAFTPYSYYMQTKLQSLNSSTNHKHPSRHYKPFLDKELCNQFIQLFPSKRRAFLLQIYTKPSTKPHPDYQFSVNFICERNTRKIFENIYFQVKHIFLSNTKFNVSHLFLIDVCMNL